MIRRTIRAWQPLAHSLTPSPCTLTTTRFLTHTSSLTHSLTHPLTHSSLTHSLIIRSFAKHVPFRNPSLTHSKTNASDAVLRNNKIPYTSMRVVYEDSPATATSPLPHSPTKSDSTSTSGGDSEGVSGGVSEGVSEGVSKRNTTWKIMTRAQALQFARAKQLDLVLVKAPKEGSTEVAVCVLQDFKLKQQQQDQAKGRGKDRGAHAGKADKGADKDRGKKSKQMKQIRVGALCESHDLNTKLNKVKAFLSEGLQVKVSIFAKKRTQREHPLALDETTLRVLSGLESVAGPVQSVSKESSRVEFIFSPIKKQ